MTCIKYLTNYLIYISVTSYTFLQPIRDAITKCHRLGGSLKEQKLISHHLEARHTRSEHRQFGCLARDLVLVPLHEQPSPQRLAQARMKGLHPSRHPLKAFILFIERLPPDLITCRGRAHLLRLSRRRAGFCFVLFSLGYNEHISFRYTI